MLITPLSGKKGIMRITLLHMQLLCTTSYFWPCVFLLIMEAFLYAHCNLFLLSDGIFCFSFLGTLVICDIKVFVSLLLKGGPGQPQNLGSNFSMWMLLERVRFTLDGLECNKIGVGYDAFNAQSAFCSASFWSCLHNQLWNFWDVSKFKHYARFQK